MAPEGDGISTDQTFVCRYNSEDLCGNMIPIWEFLVNRVKSEKTVENMRKNVMVHGSSGGESGNSANLGKEEGKSRGGRRKEKVVGESANVSESREAALNDRELAAKEVEVLSNIVRRQGRI